MATSVTINGTTYSIADPGQSPEWGEDLHDLLQALVDVANGTVTTGDIARTNFTVANNVASASDVTNLSFDTSIIRSATITYSIYRSTASNELAEHGIMLIAYKSTANSWELMRYSVGDADVTFTITNAGQIQYISSNLAGASYAGLMKFEARVFGQT